MASERSIAAAGTDIPAAREGGVNWARTRNYVLRTWPLYVMLVPALIYLILFQYYPMYGVVIAFQRFNPGLGFTRSPWVGLENFERVFTNPYFSNVLWNTVIIAVAKIVTMMVCAVTLALLLNEVKSLFFKRTVQTVIYLPYFLSWVVLGGILVDMLSTTGLVNKAIVAMGFRPIMFLGSNVWFRPMLIGTNIWQGVGWSTIIYLAALTGIDPQLHEAAAIDGATRWQRVRHVTLPGISAVVILIACLNLANVLQAGFDQVLNLYNPTVYRTGDILDTYIYRAGLISAQYSLAGAIGLFKSVIGFILILISYRLADKLAGYRIF